MSSNPYRIKAIRRATLEALKLAGVYALPDETLRKHVGDMERPQLDDEEWEDTIDWLESNGFIAAVPSTWDEDLKQWAITERGRTILATL
jgi:hypothetical protein